MNIKKLIKSINLRCDLEIRSGRLRRQMLEGRERNRRINDKFIQHLAIDHGMNTIHLENDIKELHDRSNEVYDNEINRIDHFLNLIRTGQDSTDYVKSVSDNNQLCKDMISFLDWSKLRKEQLGCYHHLDFLSER